MKIQNVNINSIVPHPNNPRVIRDSKFISLKKSVKDAPWMLEIRPIVVNEKMEIIGGSMRYRACVELGFPTVPILVANGITQEQEMEFLIKDNNSAGEWDWDILANQFEAPLLADWGFHVPDMNFTPMTSPATASREVRGIDIEKKSNQLANSFSGPNAKKEDVICPECGNEFCVDSDQ